MKQKQRRERLIRIIDMCAAEFEKLYPNPTDAQQEWAERFDSSLKELEDDFQHDREREFDTITTGEMDANPSAQQSNAAQDSDSQLRRELQREGDNLLRELQQGMERLERQERQEPGSLPESLQLLDLTDIDVDFVVSLRSNLDFLTDCERALDESDEFTIEDLLRDAPAIQALFHQFLLRDAPTTPALFHQLTENYESIQDMIRRVFLDATVSPAVPNEDLFTTDLDLGRYSRVSEDVNLYQGCECYHILRQRREPQTCYMRIAPAISSIPYFNDCWIVGKIFTLVADNGEVLEFELIRNVLAGRDGIYSAYVNFSGGREPVVNYWYDLRCSNC